MTPALSAVYDELLARAAVAPWNARAERLRRGFFARTGELTEEAPTFAVRLAAAWEDVLVGRDAEGGCLAATLAETLEDEADRDIAHLLARGQRGLFELRAEGEHRFLDDHLGGASFLLLRGDPLGRLADRPDADRALVIGRLVGAYDGCTFGYAGAALFSGILSTLGGELPLGLLIGLVFMLAGLAFKISAAPFHMWTPDVYESSPTPVTAFFATAPKVAAMALIARLAQDAFGAIPGQWARFWRRWRWCRCSWALWRRSGRRTSSA